MIPMQFMIMIFTINRVAYNSVESAKIGLNHSIIIKSRFHRQPYYLTIDFLLQIMYLLLKDSFIIFYVKSFERQTNSMF